MCFSPCSRARRKPSAPVTKDSIIKRLNTEVAYLRENPTHEDKGMVNVVINCKGEVVKCEMDNKTKNADLDKQIVAVFNSHRRLESSQIK
ncbi:MAG: hypothetical protein WDO71_26325 [Bacteroidota bacterium]